MQYNGNFDVHLWIKNDKMHRSSNEVLPRMRVRMSGISRFDKGRSEDAERQVVKMKTRVFEFKKISISCVGTNEAMHDLLSFYKHKYETGIDLYIDKMISRINANNVYCYVAPQSFLYQLEALKIKKLIKKDLLIEEWMFVDAMFLSETEKMCELFDITIEQYENEIKKESCWKYTNNWEEI